MSKYTEARYTNADHSMVTAKIDGIPYDFPAKATNSQYADLVRDSIPIAAFVPRVPTYLELRSKEYGTAKEQIEYAVENGMDALIARNLAIKEKYPKA